MISQMQDFMNEQMQIFTGQAQKFGADPLEAVRESATYSADGLKSLKEQVRVAARSGVQLTEVSQKAAEELIGLQSEMITTALTEFAASLERAARARTLPELLSAQAEAVKANGERFLSDANRATAIFAEASRGVQKVATQAYEKAAKTAEGEFRPKATAAKATAAKAKRAARKPAAKAV